MKHIYRIALVLLLVAVLAGCNDEPAPLKLSPETLPDGQVGQPYSVEITVPDNDWPIAEFYITEGELPAGLVFTWDQMAEDNMKATISGTPEAAGEYTFTVWVAGMGTNTSGPEGSREYTLVIAP